MDCVNHTGVTATSFCQSCGRALCADCVRKAAGGQVFCEPCWTAWQSYQQPFAAPPPGAPSPSVAGVLGLIPGVGAMYNGQFIKGLAHVMIFAVLVTMTSALHGGLEVFFGLCIPAWIVYQAFEAYHTALARRDGQPLPDPLGLNELGNWMGAGGRGQYPGQPGAGAGGYQNPYQQGPYQAPGQAPYQGTPYQQGPYQTPNQGPYTPPPPGAANAGVPPPVPPVGSSCWGRKEPIGAIVLIGLGVLFLLGQLDIFSGRLIQYTWPLLLIGLGVWLVVRRLGESQGGSK